LEIMDRDPSWAFYPETILEFPEGGLRVDLRSPLSEAVVAELQGLGLGGRFAVVTPCDPRGIRAGDDSNARRVAALRASLRRRGCRFVSVDGVSPDRTHGESGFAVDVPLEEAVKLARSLEQSALFWFDGEAFWVIPVLAAGEALRLPRGAERGTSRRG